MTLGFTLDLDRSRVKGELQQSWGEMGGVCGRTADLYTLGYRMVTYIKPRPDPLPGTVIRRRDKTYGCYGRRPTLTSLSDSVLCLRIAHARCLSDTTRCPMVKSKMVSSHNNRLTTVPDWGLYQFTGRVQVSTGKVQVRSCHFRVWVATAVCSN